MDILIKQPVDPRERSPGRRELRKAENRERLLSAAKALFLEKNFTDVGPKDISERADLGYGTFYSFFEDKYQCLRTVIEELTADFMSQLETELQAVPDAHTRAELVTRCLIDFAFNNPPLIELMLNESGMLQHGEAGLEQEPFVDRFAGTISHLLMPDAPVSQQRHAPAGFLLTGIFSAALTLSRSHLLDREQARDRVVEQLGPILGAMVDEPVKEIPHYRTTERLQ